MSVLRATEKFGDVEVKLYKMHRFPGEIVTWHVIIDNRPTGVVRMVLDPYITRKINYQYHPKKIWIGSNQTTRKNYIADTRRELISLMLEKELNG